MNRHLTFALLALAATSFHNAHAQAIQVGRMQRDLVLFVNQTESSGSNRYFYELTAHDEAAMAYGAVASQYRAVHVVSGSQATRDGFIARLDSATGVSSVLAVDCLFVTNALTKYVRFYEGVYTIESVVGRIESTMSVARRMKLRMIYSTACFGAQHAAGWRRAGFKCIAGSAGVCADTFVSFPNFLAQWSLGTPFVGAVSIANAADPMRALDVTAQGLLYRAGSSFWDDVVSLRTLRGTTGLSLSVQSPGL
ncbi:MAG: hypothetical protein H6837_06660 [Planctomycetes bacterium]|nr:hypothetical protein [Planctomycetota bacterium]